MKPAPAEEPGQGELLLERRSGDRRKSDRRGSGAAADGGSIRVGIDKVDAVINLVGELVTTQSMLSALGVDFDMDRIDKLHEALDQLDRNTLATCRNTSCGFACCRSVRCSAAFRAWCMTSARNG